MYNDPTYSRVSAWPRIFGLALLVVILGVGGALWFDFLGLVDVTGFFAPALRWVGLAPREAEADVEDPMLLAGSRLDKREEALALREDELAQRTAELDARETELVQLSDQLEERESALSDRENSVIERLRQVENERAALVKLSGYLTNMPPADAVEQLVEYSDELLLNVLLITDELAEASGQASLVPFWLSLLPADRAAAVGERLSLLPEIEGAD
jgi:flagellar protein FlbB